MLSKFYFDKKYIATTLIKESIFLQPYPDSQATAAEIRRYKSMISFIMFSIVETRPNIAFVILVAIQLAKNPSY